jgi:alpha-1,3-rhamnosyl/mannosyltransferase
VRVALVNLTSGGMSGGYRKYLQELLPRLASHPGITDLTVFVPPGTRLDLQGGPAIESWPEGDGARAFRAMRARLQSLAPNVVFIPTARWLDCGLTPVVVMLRNMEPLVIPFRANPLPEALKNVARAYEARRACRRATRVIAVSNYVRDVIRARWRIDDRRIGVVYHGVDPSPGRGRAPAWAGTGDPGPFVFTAGSIRPARGLEDLVSALREIASAGDRPPRVVIAGDVSPGGASYRQRLGRAAEESGVADRIVWAGGLDRDEMTWCFRNCSAFVMTSRAEACPNLALEAMSHSCACVSVDHAPMPEFFGDAALYYRAGDTDGLANRVALLLGKSSDSTRMHTAASARARTFDWKTTAERTIAELRRAIGVSAHDATAPDAQCSSG